MIFVPPIRYTIDDLEDVPNPWGDTRYEIIDGKLFISIQPDNRHQYCTGCISAAIALTDRERERGWTLMAPGIFLSDEDVVAPDVCWSMRRPGRKFCDDDGRIRYTPELMVEVLSPGNVNVRRDREAKLDLYDRWGVLEYWIVDWRAVTIDVFRRDDTGLAFVVTLGEDDTLTSPLLPGLSEQVAQLCRIPR